MTPENKIKVFEASLNKFETNEMKMYCEDMIKQIPNYIFDIPSSTSGKYHNVTQCQPHGQVYHMIMFAEIVNYRLELKWNRDKFKSPVQRDAMRCTAYFHDALKCGLNGSEYTVHEHPMLAGKWVRETKVEHDIDDKIKEAIARMCERHSGQFTTSKKSKVVLPEPENAMEFFVHECDILSSRNNIDMQPPEYLKEIFGETPAFEFDENYKLTFGKHSGEKILDIYYQHPDYIVWCEENIKKPDVQQVIKAMKKYVEEKASKIN